jgi:hypothetical protein
VARLGPLACLNVDALEIHQKAGEYDLSPRPGPRTHWFDDTTTSWLVGGKSERASPLRRVPGTEVKM